MRRAATSLWANRQNESQTQNVDEQDAENSAIALARKVSFLSRPDSYVPAPETVVTRETHMFWVFMAGQRIYKLRSRYDFHLTRNIRSVRHQCGFGHRGKHTTCRPAKNEFPQPGMPVPAHDNEIGIHVGCI